MVTIQHQKKQQQLKQQQQQQYGATSSTTGSLQQKAEEINLVLLQPDVDLWKLRELALSEGGLVNDTLRKRAWPKLVGLHKYYKYKPHFYKPKPKITAELLIEEENPSPKFEFDTSAMKSFQKEQEDADAQKHKSESPRHHGKHHSSLQQQQQQDDSSIFGHLIAHSMDAEQIERDVARCTWHLLSGTQRSRRVQYHNKHRRKVSGLLRKKQRRLANLINLTLVESYELSPSVEDRLRYYQGYHDVACIFLHALGGGNTKPDNAAANGNSNNSINNDDDKLGLELPARVLCQVSYSHFRDHLRSDFLSLQTALKVALFPLLAKLDRPVHDHLKDCDMEPFFCLSWVLTWFAHDVRDTELVKRLFDVFLCSHPMFSLYVAVAMLVHPINRQKILSTDCDFAALHQCLVMLPRNSCRVGWKRRCDGEGYVSDEEDDTTTLAADDLTASTGMDSSTYWDQEERSMSLATSASIGQSGSLASSFQSFSVGPIMVEDSYDRVPFQQLIEQALVYMKRFPPRCLLTMSKAYFQEEWNFGQQVSNISLLQNPPTWSLASTAKADWVLKQRVRQDLGLKATSRKDRRKKLKYMQQIRASSDETTQQDEQQPPLQPKEEATPLVDMEYLKANQHMWPVIAVGYGPDPADPGKNNRKKQIRIVIAVAVAAILVGVVYRQYQLGGSSDGTTTNATTPISGTPLVASSDASENGTSSSGDNSNCAPSASPRTSKDLFASERTAGAATKTTKTTLSREGNDVSPSLSTESPKISLTNTVAAAVKNLAAASGWDVEPSSDQVPSVATTAVEQNNDRVLDATKTAAGATNNESASISKNAHTSKNMAMDDGRRSSGASRSAIDTQDRSTKQNVLSPTLSKNPTIVLLKKTTQSLVRILHHFQMQLRSRFLMPLLRTFAPKKNNTTTNADGSTTDNDPSNLITLGTLATSPSPQAKHTKVE